MTVSRSRFLQALAGAGAASSLPLSSTAQAQQISRLSRALVLSGGGARGAYQAGIIGALASANGVIDGRRFEPYDFVCGSSIGALNGWMVATGQYARLNELWSNIASERILRVKPQFAAIHDENSGVITRLSQGIGLMNGLRRNVQGIFQSEPVLTWIKANMDPNHPLLLPFVWTATNLTTQQTQYFLRTPQSLPEDRKVALTTALRLMIGPSAELREVSDEELPLSLFASAAIPLVFDPVELPAPDGTLQKYVDGGVASNSPIGIARTVARQVQVVLLDPPFESDTYHNAVDIIFGVYGTMQRHLLENDVRAAFVQSVGGAHLRDVAFATVTSGLPPGAVESLQSFLANAGELELSYIRPKQVLPLGVRSFDDQIHINEAMRLGEDAGRAGFTRYTLADFFSASA